METGWTSATQTASDFNDSGQPLAGGQRVLSVNTWAGKTQNTGSFDKIDSESHGILQCVEVTTSCVCPILVCVCVKNT